MFGTLRLSETYGFLKALIAVDSDQIIGFTVVGAGASELIAVVQIAMLAGMPYTILRDSILTHPTMAEGLTVLLQTSRVFPHKDTSEAESRMINLLGCHTIVHIVKLHYGGRDWNMSSKGINSSS